MTNLVECRDLRLGYGSNAMPPCPDFTVGAGNYLCIVGANGSGKTTLLKAIAGLIKPLSGTLASRPAVSATFRSKVRSSATSRRPCAKSCSRDVRRCAGGVRSTPAPSGDGRRTRWKASALPRWRGDATANYPADNVSVSYTPARSAATAVFYFSTNPPRGSTGTRRRTSTAFSAR